MTLPTGLNEEKCRQRSRLAARLGVEAVPVRLSAPAGLATPPAGATLVSARGTLPSSEAESLERVNAVLAAQGLQPLAADRVHLHAMEAGNTHYIASRAMFLGASTLQNVARRAQAGFALMNSHRTGGLSSPAEQPYGRTYAGRFETYRAGDGREWSRAILGVYMLRGVRPNGDSGPSTDDLSAGIDAGTVFDVSLGLSGGASTRVVCDVCSCDLGATDKEGNTLCPHVPGTTHKMTRSESAAQKARGVHGGVATYTLHDAEPSEVSAVYNGAVPGAGFTRALSHARGGLLSGVELAQARESYGHLIGAHGRRPPTATLSRGTPMKLSQIFSAIGLTGDEEVENDLAPPAAPATPAPQLSVAAAELKPSPEMARLQEELKETRLALKRAEDDRLAESRRAFESQCRSSAAAFCEKQRSKLTPRALALSESLLARLAQDDRDHPVDGFSRSESLQEVVSLGAAQPHTAQVAAGGAPDGPDPATHGTTVLSNGGDGGFSPREAARKQNAEFLGRNKGRAAAGA